MKLFRDYAVLASGQVASRVLGFVAFAWLARRLDPPGYAAVEYMVGLSLLFGSLVEGGFGVVAVRRVGRDRAEMPRLAAQIPWLRLGIAVAAVPLMVAVARWLGRAVVPVDLAWLIALGLLTLPWRQEWLLQAQERMGQIAVAQFVRAAGFAVVVVAFVHGPGDLVRTGLADLAGGIAMLAYCLWVQHRTIAPMHLPRTLAGLRPVVREAALAGLGTFVLTLQQFTPLFMSAPLAGADATAWFAAAARIVAALLVFSYLYHYSLYPALTRATAGNDVGLGTLMDASFRVTAWAGTLAALALTVLAEPIVVIAFGPKLAPAAPVLQVLAWTLPLTLSSGHARWALFARGAQGDALVAQAAGVVVTAVLGGVLGPRFGALGFAVAAVGGVVAVWVGAQWRLRRIGAVPPSPMPALPPLLCAAAALVAVAWLRIDGWAALLVVFPFVLAAAVLAPGLGADLRILARAKADVERPR